MNATGSTSTRNDFFLDYEFHELNEFIFFLYTNDHELSINNNYMKNLWDIRVNYMLTNNN